MSAAPPSGSTPRRPSALVAALFLCAWILPPFWRIATLQAVNIQDDIYTSDLLNDRLPMRAFVGESVREGELPLWVPGIYTGFPALAAVEVGALYPSNLFLFGLFDAWTAVAWAQLLPLFTAGLGTFLLARELGLPASACLLAAGSFSLSGFLVAHLRQLNMVDAAAWIPFLFLLVERSLRRARPTVLPFAVVWALQLYAGHPQLSYITALALAVYFVVRWRQVDRSTAASDGRRWPVRLLAHPATRALAVALPLGTALAAAQLLPGFELAGLSHRRGGFSLAEATAYPASPWSLLTFVLPYVNGDPGLDTYRLSGIFWEQYAYLGVLPAVLALGAVIVRRRTPIVRLLAAMAALSWLLVIGPHTPLFPLLYRVVPGMSYFRFPTRFLVVTELCVALLGAFGMARAIEALRGRRLRAAAAAAILCVSAADLWTHQMRQVPMVDREAWTVPTGTASFLRDAASRAPPFRIYSLDATMVHAATFHEARGWGNDTAPFVRLRSLLQPSSNLLERLDSPDGYVNLAPRHYESVWGSDKEPGIVRPSGEIRDGKWQLHPWIGRLLRLFNVRYVVSAMPVAAPELREPRVFPEGFGIQELDDPLPRAFVVGEAIGTASDADVLEILRSADFDPERQAIVHEPVRLPSGSAPSRSARIVDRNRSSLRITATLEHPGLLVVSEGFYPGWRAWLDGNEVPIVRANMMMRAIVLPAGEHDIVFRFRPRFLFAGFGLSLAAAVVLLLFRRAAFPSPGLR